MKKEAAPLGLEGTLVSEHLCFSIPSTLKRPTDEIDEIDAEFMGPRLEGDEWSECCFQLTFILKQEERFSATKS